VLINTPGLCNVQNVYGLTPTAASRTLGSVNCQVGKISRVYSRWAKKGLVISQKPKFGSCARRRRQSRSPRQQGQAQVRASAALLVCLGIALVSGAVARSAGGTAPSFAAVKSYAIGKGSGPVKFVDVNGDGKVDLATPQYGANTVSLLMNGGDGRFAAPVTYATGAFPRVVEAGDVNGDGKPDLLTANASSISVLLNRGEGTFAAPSDYETPRLPALAVHDLNGDGRPDLVTSSYDASAVSVFLNAGDGTFGARQDYDTARNPGEPSLADLNGDGFADVVVATDANRLTVLLNGGDGTFANRLDYSTGADPGDDELADLNGDGRLDIVTANVGGKSLSVLLNDGSGGFAARHDYEAGTSFDTVDVADLNGDGHPDLLARGEAEPVDHVSVFLNSGDGSFGARHDFRTGDTKSGTLADLTHDGRPELVVTRSFHGLVVSVLLNRGNGGFQPPLDYPARGIDDVGAADLNGDGRPDVVISGSTALSVVLNRPGLCNVQYVKGLKLAAAKDRLRRGHCRPGRVRLVRSHSKNGVVLKQRLRFGVVRKAGARVALVVSKGRK
jgi:hypothetical protein